MGCIFSDVSPGDDLPPSADQSNHIPVKQQPQPTQNHVSNHISGKPPITEQPRPSSDPPQPPGCLPVCHKRVRPERPCRITGCTIMRNGYLVTVDTSNKRVKIFDANLKCRSFLILESRPFDIASIGRNLYVTLPKKKLIQKLTVTFSCICVKRKLITRSQIPTEGQCLGIVAHPRDLIVSMKFVSHANVKITDSAWQIQIMSTAGVVKRRIMHSPEGDPLFYGAKYLALTPNKKELVIAEAADNRIICMDIETEEFTFNVHMEDPKGVICDKNNHIYILGKHGSIRWILEDREYVKVLLDGTKSINYGDAITYSTSKHSLAIPRNENKIEMYKIRSSRVNEDGLLYQINIHNMKQSAIRWILEDREYVKVLLNGTKSINYGDAITYSTAKHSLAIPRN